MAGMSKRHFEALAAIIKEAPDYFLPSETAKLEPMRARIARDIADMCRQENPLFDRGRFLKACGMEG